MLDVELTVVKLQVAPVGRPAEHVKVTVPLKLFCGVIVMVVLLLFCPATAISEVGLAARVKPGRVAAQAFDRLLTSTDPRPDTRL